MRTALLHATQGFELSARLTDTPYRCHFEPVFFQNRLAP